MYFAHNKVKLYTCKRVLNTTPVNGKIKRFTSCQTALEPMKPAFGLIVAFRI